MVKIGIRTIVGANLLLMLPPNYTKFKIKKTVYDKNKTEGLIIFCGGRKIMEKEIIDCITIAPLKNKFTDKDFKAGTEIKLN